MSLSNAYRRQFGWRAWPSIFYALPPLHGQTVLDLVYCCIANKSDAPARA